MSFNITNIQWTEARTAPSDDGGKRPVRTWPIPKGSDFWSLWRHQKAALKQQGYSVRKFNGTWTLVEWHRQAPPPVPRPAPHPDQHEPAVELTATQEARYRNVLEIYERIHRETGLDFRYQLPSIRQLVVSVNRGNGGLDASDTGTGKTAVACAVAHVLARSLLVVCPLAVIPSWRRFAKEFEVDLQIINYEMLRTGNTEIGMWEGKHFVWNTVLFDPAEWLLAFDECHRMKDHRTLNCAMGVSALNTGYKVIGLSATAADNPLHMQFTALLTGLIDHASHFYGWLTAHGCRRGKWGMEFVGGPRVLQQIHHEIFPAHGTRLRIADLGDVFPETQISAEAYDMGQHSTAAIQRIYEKMRREIERLEESRSHDRGASILTAMLRARQEAELLKVPTLAQMAKDGLDEGMAVVVILNFEDAVQACARELRAPLNIIHGGDNPAERQALIDRFNAGAEDVVIMNIKAGGLGISLHKNPKRILVLLSPTFSGIDLKQALGRCHRAGGSYSIQRIVFASNTIEELACNKVRAKIRRVEILNDGELDAALAF
jgi:superfamily II DNA or RNA helicase